MKDRITIEGRDGAFGAYISRPKTLPAPAVVVLHEVFGVNADIEFISKTAQAEIKTALARKSKATVYRQLSGSASRLRSA